ncbi:hypothetical protein Enr13x_04190 [Stieleria neptunia]|uniref:Exonuclease domain-containing protein n=1 Tax=Stieleria neptunia TaxID=2527979 RepID=A0A518HII2_9BACT|nr:hypothetical protein [Stieleria neptunia]QDV40613.1 hypothetical protein Enr13x_04190 [Stieleria neptunia]
MVFYSKGYPFGITHLNVKSLFAVSLGLKHEVGLDGAYEMLGLQMEGTHHRGDDDAWNIAGILCRLLAAAQKSHEFGWALVIAARNFIQIAFHEV